MKSETYTPVIYGLVECSCTLDQLSLTINPCLEGLVSKEPPKRNENAYLNQCCRQETPFQYLSWDTLRITTTALVALHTRKYLHPTITSAPHLPTTLKQAFLVLFRAQTLPLFRFLSHLPYSIHHRHRHDLTTRKTAGQTVWLIDDARE